MDEFLVVVEEADKSSKSTRRIYSSKVLEDQVARLKSDVDNGRLLGELGTPDGVAINFSRVSHIITDLFMSEGRLMAKIKVLKTPCGKVLETLLSEGVKIDFRMAGVGNGKVNDDGYLVVGDNYKLSQIFAFSEQ